MENTNLLRLVPPSPEEKAQVPPSPEQVPTPLRQRFGGCDFNLRLPQGFLQASGKTHVYSASQQKWVNGTVLGVAIDARAGQPLGSLLLSYDDSGAYQIIPPDKFQAILRAA